MPRPKCAAVPAAVSICAVLLACSHSGRDFSAAVAGAGNDVADAGNAGTAGALPVVLSEAGSGGSAGAAGSVAAAPSAGAAGCPPGGSAGALAAAGGRKAISSAAGGSEPGGGPSEASGAGAGAGGAAGSPTVQEGGNGGEAGAPLASAGAGGSPPVELATAGSAGTPSPAPAGELCVTVQNADVARIDVTSPAVVGSAARLSWEMPEGPEDYVAESIYVSGCESYSVAVHYVTRLVVTCVRPGPGGWTLQGQVHLSDWRGLPASWVDACYTIALEVGL